MARTPSIVRRVRDQIARAFVEHAMRPEGGRVLVACSGGPDSSTLLDAMWHLRARLDIEIEVVTVDHQLRPESRAEAVAVLARAKELGVPGHLLIVDVQPRSMAGAREARYRAIAECAARIGVGAVAVAHTATDQAETFIDRLIRGAGSSGLAAMRAVRPLGPERPEGTSELTLARPMLSITAAEVAAYVAARQLAVVSDPSNHNRAYRRSRIRHDILPLLQSERPGIDRALARLCDRLRADDQALQAEADRVFPVVVARPGWLDVTELATLPEALRLRVLRRFAGGPIEDVHLRAIERLCSSSHGTRVVQLSRGQVAERWYGYLRIGAPSEDPGDVELAVTSAGRYTLLPGSVVDVSLELYETLSKTGELRIRNLRPGDRLMGHCTRIKERLIDQKLPRPLRRRLPVLVRRREECEEILWVGTLAANRVEEISLDALTDRGAVQ